MAALGLLVQQVQQLKEQATAAHQAGNSNAAIKLLTAAIQGCKLALDQAKQPRLLATTTAHTHPAATAHLHSDYSEEQGQSNGVQGQGQCPEPRATTTSHAQSAATPSTSGLHEGFSKERGQSNGVQGQGQVAVGWDGPQLQHLLSVLYSNRAALHAEQSAFVQSCVDAKLAIQQDPTWTRPYHRLATAYLGLEQPQAALQALDRGIATCNGLGTHARSGLTTGACFSAAVQEIGSSTCSMPPATATIVDTGVEQLKLHRADVAVVASAAKRWQRHHHSAKRIRYSTSPLPPVLLSAASTGTADMRQDRKDPAISLPQGPELVAHCLDILDAAAAARGLTPGAQPDANKVGITVLSGFLGSGKTTLLQRIVAAPHSTWIQAGRTVNSSAINRTTDQVEMQRATAVSSAQDAAADVSSQPGPLKFGVVVNDMASLNIDGMLARHALQQASEQPAIEQPAAAGALTAAPADSTTGAGATPASQADGRHIDEATCDGPVAGLSGAHHLVELSNGCICCNLRGDMLQSVSELLASAPELNYLLVESTGVGQPLPIAAGFASMDHRGRSLLDYVRIDCMVTVVDAHQFTQLMASKQTQLMASKQTQLMASKQTAHAAHMVDAIQVTAAAAGQPQPDNATVPQQATGSAGDVMLAPEDCRPLAELLAEQVEFADVILVNKCDLLPTHSERQRHHPPASDANKHQHMDTAPSQGQQHAAAAAGKVIDSQEHIIHIVQGLNPGAKVIPTCYCDCPLTEVVNTHRFNFEAMESSARWQRELMTTRSAQDGMTHQELPETVVYGIHSMVYESRRPFHPGRLAACINAFASKLSMTHPHQQHQQLSQQQQQQQQGNMSEHTGQAPMWSTAGAPDCLQPSLPACLLRSKGFFWVASCPGVAWEWSTAGSAATFTPYGEWLAGKLPHHCWPEQGKWEDWDATWGDRRNSLVFIYQRPAEAALLKAMLDTCILTDEEVAAGVNAQHPDGNGCLQKGGSMQGETVRMCDLSQGSDLTPECDLSEDAIWFMREESWRQLPGAHVWDSLLPD